MATIDFSTVPSGVTLNEERAQQLSDRATETATAFSRKIEKLQNTVTEARDNYAREADELIASASPEDRATARAFAKKNAANKAANIHRQLIASSEADRAAMLKGLQTLAAEAAAIQAVYTSPATMLGRVALGDPKRTQYQLQLEGAGPVEMETAARTAIDTRCSARRPSMANRRGSCKACRWTRASRSTASASPGYTNRRCCRCGWTSISPASSLPSV